MYEVYGKNYENIKDISEEYGLNAYNLRHYIKSHGASSIEHYIASHRIIVNGKSFQSLSEACKFYDVKYNSVYEKVKRKGISIGDAINALLENKRNGRLNAIIDGRKVTSIKELAILLNINEKTASKYIKKYDSVDRAVEAIKKDIIDVREQREKSYNIFGKSFKHKKEIADFYHISYESLNKSKNIKETVKKIVYEKSILEEYGGLRIVRIEDTICFILEQELEKVLLYKDFDSEFLEERKLEIY